MKKTILCFVLSYKKLALSLAIALMGMGAQAAEKTAFKEVLFDAAPSVKVQIGNDTFYLLSIDGVKRADLMSQCEAVYQEKCPCYFAEKFTETMAKIGHPVGEAVALRLYNFQNHQVLEIPNHPVTEDNQMALIEARELRNGRCSQ